MRADKHQKKRKWPKVVGIIFLLLLLAGGGYAYSIYHSLNKTAETMNEKIDRPKSEKRTEEVKFEKKHPFSVLLLGVDERDGDPRDGQHEGPVCCAEVGDSLTR